jgi:site-specific DNA-methyltransferase (adenine-specific)
VGKFRNGEMMNPVLLSSKSTEWETPQEFYEKLNMEFNFQLDPCATRFNHKCREYFTIEDDGLKQPWGGKTVFMNPPYGRAVGNWIKKAYEESLKGATVVCLIPSRTDTAYWHDYCVKGEIRFIRGRLKFGGSENSAPFPSAVVIFRPPVSSLESTRDSHFLTGRGQ